jgi:uncharacterized protein YecE (DUF72 family)
VQGAALGAFVANRLEQAGHFAQPDRMTGSIRIGIGGWVFAPWRGSFFPEGLPHSGELAYAAERVTSIEINATFYGPQRPESFRRWRDETPPGFVFSVKGPRGATHRRDLDMATAAIDRFFAGGVAELGDKLGPFLWQFPPTRSFELDWFNGFLEHLPRELGGRRLRHVVELRHRSFDAEDWSMPKSGRSTPISARISSMPGWNG